MLAASVAGLALASSASAEYLVPPGNSAATQYTEAVPTAGGHRDAERQSPQQNHTPSQVLGEQEAEQLEGQGAAGREAAEFAAETAPNKNASGESQSPPDESNEGRGGKAEDGEAREEASGSSGLGEIVGQATGSTSGELGWLLPLALLATAAWAVAFLLRRRQRPTP